MFKKSLFYCLLLAIHTLPQALHAGLPTPTEPSSSETHNCTLPAPGNFHTVSVGSSEAVVAWDAVPGAWGYKLYITPGGSFQSASGITTATSMNISDLLPGITYSVKVHALCSINSQSINFSQLQLTTIVIEIVCEAHDNFEKNHDVINDNNVFTHDWNDNEDYRFQVLLGSTVIGEFDFEVGGNTVTFSPMGSNPPGLYLGRASFGTYPVYCNSQGEGGGIGGTFKVKLEGTVVTDGTFRSSTALKFTPYGNYTIAVQARLQVERPAPPGSADRESSQPPGALIPAPNPFHEVLYLNGSGGFDKPVQLALYDARGCLAKQQEIAPDDFSEGAFALPTHDLPPGIYFLQLRSEAGCTTHKLLKH